MQVAYYDQQREQLDPERTVFDVVGDGNDTVTVNGQSRHVHSYLRDFLFSDERARSPVKALSGGERNRLLLARLFTRPSNVLVLDEPTNDLDLETLELLEAQLAEWPGTLLLVSHDRTFLDNVVTSTLAFEGQGRVAENVGGYEDWLRQSQKAGHHTRSGEWCHAGRAYLFARSDSAAAALASCRTRSNASSTASRPESRPSRKSSGNCATMSQLPSSIAGPPTRLRRPWIASKHSNTSSSPPTPAGMTWKNASRASGRTICKYARRVEACRAARSRRHCCRPSCLGVRRDPR